MALSERIKDRPSQSGAKRRMPRRHVLMLALALEVLWLGVANADRYSPPGITIDQTLTEGNVIT